jgi:hypothetical protein
MRTIALLLMAALTLVGAASAWSTTEDLFYQYSKEVDIQGGQDLGLLIANSYASASSPNAYGDYGWNSMSVSNSVWDVSANLLPVNGATPDTENTVTQWGAAQIVTNAPDLEDPCGIQFAGAAIAGQEVGLSGNYNDVYVGLDSYANVGVWNEEYDPVNGVWNYDETYASGYGGSDGTVTSTDAFIEATIGQSVEVDLEQINAPGADATFSGEVTSWTGFDGAYDANDDGWVDVYTDNDNWGNFYFYDYE